MEFEIMIDESTPEQIAEGERQFQEFKSELSKLINVYDCEDIYALWYMYCSGYSIGQVSEMA